MFREMITLPLRVGAYATRVGVHVTARAAGVAFGITRRLIAGSVPTYSRGTAASARVPSSTLGFDVVIVSPPPRPEAAPAAAPAPPRVVPEAIPTATSATETMPAPEAPAAPEIAPVHVSEGLQFVEAFAEPGAEEGAGAQVHVKEPWRGYSQMTADEVIVHLADASPEELAAVALYEGVHRRRKTVLTQARRLLRSATVAGPAAQARRA
jgi:hypothetical protein